MIRYLTLLAIAILGGAFYFAAPKSHTSITTDPATEKYWYNNEAELSSYRLTQARYGEVHEGQAVMVFVTEHFSPRSYTKVDRPTKQDVPVLKHNFTKKFYTGVYPYSMMTSTFFPFINGRHSIKVTSSSQEWCGHTFMELKEKPSSFDIQLTSYFEGESRERIKLDKTFLEDDVWSMIRLSPQSLPTGTKPVVPAFFYLRLMHQPAKVYQCQLQLDEEADRFVYQLYYPSLDRRVAIFYEKQFPFKILGWEESYYSGFGTGRKKLTSSAELLSTIKSDYWNRNAVQDSVLRQKLMLQ